MNINSRNSGSHAAAGSGDFGRSPTAAELLAKIGSAAAAAAEGLLSRNHYLPAGLQFPGQGERLESLSIVRGNTLAALAIQPQEVTTLLANEPGHALNVPGRRGAIDNLGLIQVWPTVEAFANPDNHEPSHWLLSANLSIDGQQFGVELLDTPDDTGYGLVGLTGEVGVGAFNLAVGFAFAEYLGVDPANLPYGEAQRHLLDASETREAAAFAESTFGLQETGFVERFAATTV